MKKFLGILAIATTMVACNNSADSTENTKDSLDSVERAKNDTMENRTDRAQDSLSNVTEAQKDSVNKADSAAHK